MISYAVENNKLSDFLYRVDLSENQAMRCMESSDPIHSLTQAILERVAQKVIFRRQYSGNNLTGSVYQTKSFVTMSFII